MKWGKGAEVAVALWVNLCYHSSQNCSTPPAPKPCVSLSLLQAYPQGPRGSLKGTVCPGETPAMLSAKARCAPGAAAKKSKGERNRHECLKKRARLQHLLLPVQSQQQGGEPSTALSCTCVLMMVLMAASNSSELL